MKKIIISILLLIFAFNIHGQRYCGSELNLDTLQQTNPARYQRIMAIESQTFNSIPQDTIYYSDGSTYRI